MNRFHRTLMTPCAGRLIPTLRSATCKQRSHGKKEKKQKTRDIKHSKNRECQALQARNQSQGYFENLPSQTANAR